MRLKSLVVVAVLISGCEKKEKVEELQAIAEVKGSTVVVTAACTGFESIGAEGVVAQCKDGNVRLEVPVGARTKGMQTIQLRSADRSGATVSLGTVHFDASLAGQPYIRVVDCKREEKADDSSTTADLETDGRKTDCFVQPNGHIVMAVEANPGAKLTIGGATVAVPESGTLTQSVDLVPQVLALSLDKITGETKAPATFTVPYSLSVGDKKSDGTIKLVESVGEGGSAARKLLKQIGKGNVARPGFKGLLGVRALVRADASLLVVGSGTVGDLGVLAIERETATTENGTCVYKDVDGKEITAKRSLVDIEVVAMNLKDGSTVEKKAFESPRDPDNCPMFESIEIKNPKATARVSNEVLKGWLGQLTH